MPEVTSDAQPKICVVGSGTEFLSGISYFTLRLVTALTGRAEVSVILMRRLIPRFLYPGRARVGANLTELRYPPDVPVHDGVDWYWGRTMLGAFRLIWRERPGYLLLQWWTGAVLHSMLALSIMARALGAKVIVEFHETQDPGESRLAVARWYVRTFARLLMRTAGAFVIHSEHDRPMLEERFRIDGRPVAVIPHGPYDHHEISPATQLREAPEEAVNLFFFGTIRPYKGLEDLVAAFELLCDADPERFWLTVVGETWEGWTAPIGQIRRSPYQHRITLRNEYVTDQEVGRWFAGADISVLPYRRSSASGPLHLSMSVGLPVVVTAVGGLPEAAGDYGGVVFAQPHDAEGLAAAIAQATALRGRRFEDPHSWSRTCDEVIALISELEGGRRSGTPVPPTGWKSPRAPTGCLGSTAGSRER